MTRHPSLTNFSELSAFLAKNPDFHIVGIGQAHSPRDTYMLGLYANSRRVIFAKNDLVLHQATLIQEVARSDILATWRFYSRLGYRVESRIPRKVVK